jgi:hypothetical protein
MALFALGRVAGLDFTESVMKGLEWIGGRNELQFDMRDRAHPVIWRSIRFSSRTLLLGQELRFWLDARPGGPAPTGLTVLRECRPYHLGWLLYAFATDPVGSGS